MEKVAVLADPAVPHAEVYQRIHAHGRTAELARARGQLTITSMRELIRPDTRFTARRQMERLREETETARREGFAGFRTVIDMAWVEDLGMDIEGVMHRETHADALFADRRYAEICTYDRRRFHGDVLEAMRTGHPVALLDRLGALRIEHLPQGVRLVGDADVATLPQLLAALPAVIASTAGTPHATVDLTGLCFLDADCASAVLGVAGRSDPGGQKLEIRCRPFHAKMLRLLGARAIKQITLTTVEEV